MLSRLEPSWRGRCPNWEFGSLGHHCAFVRQLWRSWVLIAPPSRIGRQMRHALPMAGRSEQWQGPHEWGLLRRVKRGSHHQLDCSTVIRTGVLDLSSSAAIAHNLMVGAALRVHRLRMTPLNF